MKWAWKRLPLALGLAAVAVAGAFLAGGRSPAQAEGQTTAKTEPAVTARRTAFIAAYDNGDAKAVASFWTEDATYEDRDGRQYKGRTAIERLYEKAFAANKGAKLSIHITSTRHLGPDVVIDDGITQVAPAGHGLPIAARFTAVLVKRDGEWYLDSVRDAVPRPPSDAEHLDELEWLIGRWTGEDKKGESGKATYDWAQNQNFIVSSFAITHDGVPVGGGTQWIGWDAADKQIRSWSFYSRGGFGEGVWTKEGNTWALKTTARTATGKKVTATNIVTKIDNDHMTWQVTKLSVDGESVPDQKLVKLKRVQRVGP